MEELNSSGACAVVDLARTNLDVSRRRLDERS